MTNDDIIKLCVLFNGLTEEEYQLVKSKLSLRTFSKKEVVITCNQKVQSLFIIKKGIVKMECIAKDKNFTLSFLEAGRFFGATGLFTGEASQVGASCVTECEIYQIKKEDIDTLLFTIPIFTYNLLHILSEKVIKGYDLIQQLAFQTVKQRIANKLLKFSKTFESIQKQKESINLPVTQLELAQSVGSARENVARILIEMRDKGILRLETKNIVIINPEELQKML
ncbi:Crp/Fnr family transcriptional regulator [Candidatus Peregrinibacteria bacterium]|jgi:CRP-like cAMP-binding protein|nr:Crp/Fnr family transcriptional regulator [Candidatus Peregrinibacteria bacterium]